MREAMMPSKCKSCDNHLIYYDVNGVPEKEKDPWHCECGRSVAIHDGNVDRQFEWCPRNKEDNDDDGR